MISISCIVPIYNVESYIQDCLDSITNQSYCGPIECLLIDDCGSDNSMCIVEEYISQYVGPVRFKIIKHEHNRGLSGARNTGINNATGDYIYFLDSDDNITADCFSLLTAPLKDKQYDIIVGNFRVNPPQPYHTHLNIKGGTSLFGDDILKQYGSFNIYMMAWNKLCRRDFLLRNQLFFYEGILHEDELWSYLIALHASSLYIVDNPVYIYNLREGSIMTSSKVNKRIGDLMTVAGEMISATRSLHKENNTFATNCILNVVSKPIALCVTKKDAIALYETIFSKINYSRFDIIKSYYSSPRKLVTNLHWFLPSQWGFKFYKRLFRLRFKE